MEYKYAVFVGRFQPFHNGHLEVIKQGLDIADRVIVVIGSSRAAPSPRNPWTFAERKEMIDESFAQWPHDRRPIVVGVRDYYYNLDAWLMDVQAKTGQYIKEGDSVALLGQFKDASSYYLKLFPQWTYESVNQLPIHGTDVRNALLGAAGKGRDWEGKVAPASRPDTLGLAELIPPATMRVIDSYVGSKRYALLCEEWSQLQTYRQLWVDVPFPPTFVTVDAVVTTSGHVLVVERKSAPGKGLFALPGGFLKQNEHIEDGMLRELKEETGIRVSKTILRSQITASNVFDHPERSLRGRTISHGYHIQLKDGELPEVRGNDDAAAAFWMPLWDVIQNEDKFFEDHMHIISYFTSAGGGQ